MKSIKSSLKFKIPFFIVIFVVIAVSITGILSLFIATKNTKKEVLEKNLLISKIISERIYQYLSDATDTVITAANFSSQSYGDMEQIKKEIFRIYDNFTYFDLIFYTNSEADMLFSKPSNAHVADRKYYDRDYYNAVMETGKPFVSRLLVSSVLGRPHFIIAAPVFDKDGKVQGLIGGGIPLESISKIVEEIQKDFNGRIWVTDRHGVVAVHPDKKLVLKLIPTPHLRIHFLNSRDVKSIENIIKEKTECIGFYEDGNEVIYTAISFVPKVNWMIIVEQYKKDVFSQILHLKTQLNTSILIIILISSMFGMFFAKSITNPIERLVKGVRSFGKGISKVEKIPVTSDDEIGELSRAFNDMCFQLKSYVNQLKNSYQKVNEVQQYLNNIIESAASGILVMNKNKTITVFNKTAEKITGFKSSEMLNKSIFDFCKATKFDINLIKDIKLLEDRTDRIITDRETTLITKDKKKIPISVAISPVKDDEDKILGIVLLFRDLSQIKMLEEELKREDRIRILGELSASIIHEIGNPLAGIYNLLEVLKENWNDKEIRDEIVATLEDEVGNLNKMVINFLRFCKTSQLDLKPTDITQIIEDVLNLIKPDVIAQKIKVIKKIDSNIPKVYIDQRSIKQCFLNILTNAVQASDKFGIIVVECRVPDEMKFTNDETNKYVQITIIDNGEGIPPENIEKIFSPFFTTKKSGTGLGLSIAHKLIKENGGKITLKSEIGKGTEVSVFLPVASEDFSREGDLS